MSKLKELHHGLEKVRRWRRNARAVTGYGGLALAVLWVLAGLFLVDWLFEMTQLQRVVAMAVGAGVVVWAARRYTLPWLGKHESELDVALLVERQQNIDSDLVAALQFETPQARGWGSEELEEAVVDYVAEFGRSWNLLSGFTRDEMKRRARLVAVTLLLLGGVVVMYPRHASTFFRRLLLASTHYPTQTQIERIVINDQPIEKLLPADQVTAKCPYGQPLRFEVACRGKIPAAGRVELRTVGSGLETIVELVPAPNQSQSESGDSETVYVGELPRVVDSLYCQLYLGDAWTEPAQLAVLPLPSVEARLKATPPKYAAEPEVEESEESHRQLSVVEGSRVDLEVACENKRLTEVTLVIDKTKTPLVKQDEHGRLWALTAEDTALAKVTKPVSYRILAVDQDGMSPRRPIVGHIRIKADRPPQISGSLVTRYVLPTARPKISYRAADDYGLEEISLRVQVEREGGEPGEETRVAVRGSGQPVLRDGLPLRDEFALDLSQFDLQIGDRLKVTLEAIDYRGQAAGRSSLSDPLVLNVTDESGVLGAISESDERSVRQLDEIIKRQLGIGGKP